MRVSQTAAKGCGHTYLLIRLDRGRGHLLPLLDHATVAAEVALHQLRADVCGRDERRSRNGGAGTAAWESKAEGWRVVCEKVNAVLSLIEREGVRDKLRAQIACAKSERHRTSERERERERGRGRERKGMLYHDRSWTGSARPAASPRRGAFAARQLHQQTFRAAQELRSKGQKRRGREEGESEVH